MKTKNSKEKQLYILNGNHWQFKIHYLLAIRKEIINNDHKEEITRI